MGNILKRTRQFEDLSVRTVARRLGISQTEVLELEKKEDGDVTVAELLKYAKVLHVPVSALVAELDERVSPEYLRERVTLLRCVKTLKRLQEVLDGTEGTAQNLLKQFENDLRTAVSNYDDLSAWPSVGHRRSPDEFGAVVDNIISTRFVDNFVPRDVAAFAG